MSILRALAMMAIAVGCTRAAALADQRSSAPLAESGGVLAAALTGPAPQPDPGDATPESCPYLLDSDMPAATFCVYRGVAWGGGGEVCATDIIVMWRSQASQAPVTAGSEDEAPALNREVYLAFVGDPALVVRAIVDPRRGDRAEMSEYRLGGEEGPQTLAGQMTLQAARRGSAEVLSMDFREPRRFHIGGCTFASYAGTFFGMIRPPSETAAVDPLMIPLQ